MDDAACALVVTLDVIEDFMDFIHFGRLRRQKTARGLGVAENSGQRLIQFVRKHGGALAQQVNPRIAIEIAPCLLQLLFIA